MLLQLKTWYLMVYTGCVWGINVNNRASFLFSFLFFSMNLCATIKVIIMSVTPDFKRTHYFCCTHKTEGHEGVLTWRFDYIMALNTESPNQISVFKVIVFSPTYLQNPHSFHSC